MLRPSAGSARTDDREPVPARERRVARALVAGHVMVLVGAAVPGRRGSGLRPPARWCADTVTAAGVGLAAAGAASLGRGLTASPLPNDRSVLRTGGLYAHVRHPVYSGLLLFAGGRAAAIARRSNVAACAGLAVLLTVKAWWEEQYLAARFPSYRDYAARTPRFVPRRRP